MINKPNLFKFATSELSQDAFISWLLAWADPSYRNQDSHLHDTGLKLINTLFSLNASKEIPATIDSVEVIRQFNKIDILCIVNQQYAILIEDKTNTQHRANQLTTYYNKLQVKYSDELIHPVYFKTGDQSCYKGVKSHGYSVFLRPDFLEVLNYGAELGINSDIFHSFRDYLQTIEDEVNSYLTIPYEKWHRPQWIGFYKNLQKQLGEGEWGYVPQKDGGFLCYHWKWFTKELNGVNFRSYLQLEERKFCFKIIPSNKTNAGKERDFYRGNLFKKAKDLGVDLRRNGRIGNSMTVAALKGSHIEVNEDKIINMEKTVENFRRMEELISSIQ